MSLEIEGGRKRGHPRRYGGIVTKMQSFGLSCDNAQDKDDWRVRIKDEPAKLVLPIKCLLKWSVCTGVSA